MPYDGVPRGTCLSCGLIGSHPGRLACIDALRDRLADLQFEVERARQRPPWAIRTARAVS